MKEIYHLTEHDANMLSNIVITDDSDIEHAEDNFSEVLDEIIIPEYHEGKRIYSLDIKALEKSLDRIQRIYDNARTAINYMKTLLNDNTN